MNAEDIGLWAGFVLTLMIFSYALGDNALYRIAIHVFAGLAAGFTVIITVESVLLPWANATIVDNDGPASNAVVGVIPFILAFFLLFKSSRRLTRIGNLAIAFVIGIGATVALLGAISGTLLPLADATGQLGADLNGASDSDLLNSLIIIIGVITSLVYFQYWARRRLSGQPRRLLPVRLLSIVGQGFIVVTLGALYASAILTSLTIFSERVSFLITRVNGS